MLWIDASNRQVTRRSNPERRLFLKLVSRTYEQRTENLNMKKNKTTHPIVSRDEWIAARRKLLKKEKEITLQRDAVSAKRRELPWVRVEKEYVFDGPDGKQTLADLFDGRSQLFVKHFMLAPGQETQCVGCSFEVDHIGGVLVHLENHDVSYVAVARAPLAEIAVMKKRMGWRFKWVSSFGSDFNYDFHVSFTPDQIAQGKVYYNYERREIPIEDMSGNSVFYKDEAGDIFHTYSTFGRGGEAMLGTYAILDLLPKGRNETGPYHSLGDWVRPHDRYQEGGSVEATGRYHSPKPSDSCCASGDRHS
jgi:predicted dithiol-disulfide oxidoreductase (DUF899 family)